MAWVINNNLSNSKGNLSQCGFIFSVLELGSYNVGILEHKV